MKKVRKHLFDFLPRWVGSHLPSRALTHPHLPRKYYGYGWFIFISLLPILKIYIPIDSFLFPDCSHLVEPCLGAPQIFWKTKITLHQSYILKNPIFVAFWPWLMTSCFSGVAGSAIGDDKPRHRKVCWYKGQYCLCTTVFKPVHIWALGGSTHPTFVVFWKIFKRPS